MVKSRNENKSKARSKKGFIFTLLALLVISFMVIEISIYFSAYQVRQESEPLKIRTKVVEEFATQLTGENIQSVSNIAAYNAVHALAKDAVIQPVAGTSIDNISNVIGGLFLNGTRPDTGKILIENGTLESWKSNLTDLADKVGIDLTLDSDPSKFKVNQSDPWTVQINYTFTYSLWDDYTKTKISDTYNVSVNVSIVGAEDPLFGNQTRLKCQDPGCIRNIFNYEGIVNTSKIFTADSGRGKGWFYGEMFKGMLLSSTDLSESDYTEENKLKILYTDNRFLAEDYGNMFGAVIYHGDFYTDIGPAISVPFIAVPGNVAMPPQLPIAVLIKSGSDTTEDVANFTIYDIEAMRSFLTCTYYTTNPDAPSFFDRLSEGRSNPNMRLNPGMGIETSIVGLSSWATDKTSSSIDHMYYNQTLGTKVMGMTGCKFSDMCRDAISPKFLVDTSHISWYGLDDLVCSGDNEERCR